jgi:alcohol dehydrogenase class IV
MTIIRGNFEIYLGENAIRQVIARVNALEYQSPLILIDANLSKNQRATQIIKLVEGEFKNTETCQISLGGEPTYSDLDREFEQFQNRNFDFIVAIGGGSLLDLAKGLSVLFTNPGPGINYRGMHKVKKPGLPLVVFPSTAGTGTEMTWTASFVDTTSETKLGINGDNVFPQFAVLDPGLLVGAPKSVLLSAALDTLVHAIEATTSTMANPFTVALGKTSVQRVLENIELALQDVPSTQALEMLQLAAAEAGLAMLNSSGGPASGISYPLGVHFSVPHGFAGGILLPPVIRENIRLGYKGYSIFDSTGSSGENFLEALESLFIRLNVPKNFASWNFHSVEHVKYIIDLTLEQRAENLKLNPVLFDEASLARVLKNFVSE